MSTVKKAVTSPARNRPASYALLADFLEAVREAVQRGEAILEESGDSLHWDVLARGEDATNHAAILDFDVSLESVRGALWALEMTRSVCEPILPPWARNRNA